MPPNVEEVNKEGKGYLLTSLTRNWLGRITKRNFPPKKEDLEVMPKGTNNMVKLRKKMGP